VKCLYRYGLGKHRPLRNVQTKVSGCFKKDLYLEPPPSKRVKEGWIERPMPQFAGDFRPPIRIDQRSTGTGKNRPLLKTTNPNNSTYTLRHENRAGLKGEKETAAHGCRAPALATHQRVWFVKPGRTRWPHRPPPKRRAHPPTSANCTASPQEPTGWCPASS
jgi:hypothetical protein